ncbi:endonuclease/exonuclease/phosphatase family protein [Allorhodopirellula heiligendammensis]|uniref:Endonuclease/Exonuclease/phosphatase family protein n=1 Tax=Allorhodopirellula heiligendammensis TaxID=2714739 RepID=A0A5C6C7Z9_9BACT|nr:endonuclease/exonuclease/phosphatase family protein [Allorhodopirellula heiligendammensis]TWU19444.1 Endonuclease/Exonuclease/phosphatase family protein [Allorhodopirellula heiligendammensis]
MTKTLLLTLAVLCLGLTSAQTSLAAELHVMTFNLWHGGEAGGEPLEKSIDAIRLAKADIVGLQETLGRAVDGVRPDNGAKIAKMMGWHYLDQGGSTGILSRFPILASTPKKWGAKIELSPGRELMFFNVHFPHAPYQPYQLLRIPYANAPFLETESQAIDAAQKARGSELTSLLAELRISFDMREPVILTGDFNEPSHQDWTERAAATRKCPLKVEFPTTQRVTEVGMVDAWRAIYPNEVVEPGLTWTTTTSISDPHDHHDRIDFIFVSPHGLTTMHAATVGEQGGADIELGAWPSDHRAVVATLASE